MKAKDINKVVDNISAKLDAIGAKLGIAADKIIEAYKGEAKIYVTTFRVQLFFTLLLTLIGAILVYFSFDFRTEEIERDIFGSRTTDNHFTTVGYFLFWLGIILTSIGIGGVIDLYGRLSVYLEAWKAPDTYAVTKIINKLT